MNLHLKEEKQSREGSPRTSRVLSQKPYRHWRNPFVSPLQAGTPLGLGLTLFLLEILRQLGLWWRHSRQDSQHCRNTC
ncbi:hypothetical protein E2C01_058544 [Portunus trituberculatus]|uniref:Uncharacterized protein n=1 Tax=Portunus trituberculatus TaxID=210409 RepID=A0A5B7H5N7_PORTR|nr:hypothetical protein [Portunus trituberculatus]